MKKLVVAVLAICLSAVLTAALAANVQMESVEYKGFGIWGIEFTGDCDWYASSAVTLQDADGVEVPFVYIGGEADDCYLYAQNVEDGAALVLRFQLNGTDQQINVRAETGMEFEMDGNGNVREHLEKEVCDRCGNAGHDDDFCPAHVDANNLPTDADALARLFDIDRCDRCGGMGHDDDFCPNR